MLEDNESSTTARKMYQNIIISKTNGGKTKKENKKTFHKQQKLL